MNATTGDADFEKFWQAYPRPRRQAKKAALKAWGREKPNIQVVLDALAWQTKSQDWTKDNFQYAPMASTYVNGRRWEDEKPGWAFREAQAKVAPLVGHSHEYTLVISVEGDEEIVQCSSCPQRIVRSRV